MDLSARKDFSIILGVQNRELAHPVIKSLHPLQTHILIGDSYPSFSKLVNDAIVLCPTEIFIFCSHRVRPTPEDIKILLQRIDEGHGLATLYRLGCFGFKKDLIRKIGFFDERFSIGGWEDNDFFMRLQEADISYFEDESIAYEPGNSLWKHPDGKPRESEQHFYAKWHKNNVIGVISRILPEITHYDIGTPNNNTIFKKWSESRLLSFSAWQNNVEIVDKEHVLTNKRILIFGGTGSLGHKLVDILGPNNQISIFSRDENKHWHMGLKYTNVDYILGNIRDSKRVQDTILDIRPDIIIIAAALKHVDKCEYEVTEAYDTNCYGVINVLDSVKMFSSRLSNLKHVVFISTDKACSPINTYGLSKALAEKAVVEMSFKMKNKSDIKFLTVRYGNVLNSRGSIIEVLNNMGKTNIESYKLTHPAMTRFIMTQEDAVRLICYAMRTAQSGDIVIPKLHSMRIKDLIELFAEKYNKSIIESGLRPGEKLHEALLNDTELPRTVEKQKYFILKPPYNCEHKFELRGIYNSSTPIIPKQQLLDYLKALNFY